MQQTLTTQQTVASEEKKSKKLKYIIIVLATILIIIILSIGGCFYLGFHAFDQTKLHARDTVRKGDVMNITPALKIYFGQYSKYPENIYSDINFSKILQNNRVPLDPSSNAQYEYSIKGAFYYVCAELEEGTKFCESNDPSYQKAEPKPEAKKKEPYKGYSEAYDRASNSQLKAKADNLESYKNEYGSYKGDPEEWFTIIDTDDKYCAKHIKFLVSPDGEKYVMHIPLCADNNKSLCYDSTNQEVIKIDNITIGTIENNYTCN